MTKLTARYRKLENQMDHHLQRLNGLSGDAMLSALASEKPL